MITHVQSNYCQEKKKSKSYDDCYNALVGILITVKNEIKNKKIQRKLSCQSKLHMLAVVFLICDIIEISS